MTDGVDLRSLLERVQKAQGPDPFLDKELIVGFDLRDDAMWVQWSDGRNWVARPVTGSIDAATQLVSKLLPDYGWGVHVLIPGRFRAQVTERSPIRPMPNIGDAPTPELALCTALLKALIAKAEAEEGVGEF